MSPTCSNITFLVLHLIITSVLSNNSHSSLPTITYTSRISLPNPCPLMHSSLPPSSEDFTGCPVFSCSLDTDSICIGLNNRAYFSCSSSLGVIGGRPPTGCSSNIFLISLSSGLSSIGPVVVVVVVWLDGF